MKPGAGCVAKMPALGLESLLGKAYGTVFGQNFAHPMHQPDDCYALPTERGRLLVTTDFGPLVGTTTLDAGRIAALHAMSDIYASGGVPKWALAILILDGKDSNSESDFGEQLLGSLIQTCREEAVEIQGGHTVLGSETMIGLTVIGTPRNGVVLRKLGGKIGDHLLLSKPVGLGIMIKARQLDLIGNEEFGEALRHIRTSNKEASRYAVEAKVNASTDVSGFGLLGHLSEMLGPDQGATLNLQKIPILDRIADLPEGIGCTLADGNLWYVRSRFRLVGFQETSRFYPLADPQTNGGLLVAATAETAARLADKGFHDIGCITGSNTIEILDPEAGTAIQEHSEDTKHD